MKEYAPIDNAEHEEYVAPPTESIHTEFFDPVEVVLEPTKEVTPPVETVDMSRRKFLGKIGAVAVIAPALTAIGLSPTAKRAYTETVGREEALHALKEARDRLRLQCGIEVDFGPTQEDEAEAGYTVKAIETLVDKKEACEKVYEMFSMYPQVLYKKEAIISVVRPTIRR